MNIINDYLTPWYDTLISWAAYNKCEFDEYKVKHDNSSEESILSIPKFFANITEPKYIYILTPGSVSGKNIHYVYQFADQLKKLDNGSILMVFERPRISSKCKDFNPLCIQYSKDVLKYVNNKYPKSKICFVGFSFGGFISIYSEIYWMYLQWVLIQ